MLLGLTTAIYEILGAIFRAIKQKSLMGLFKYWWVLLCSYFKHCRGSCNFYWHVKNCKRLLVRSKTIMKLYWSLIIHLFMVFFFYIYHTQYTTKEKPNIQSCSHKKKKRAKTESLNMPEPFLSYASLQTLTPIRWATCSRTFILSYQ